MEKSYRKWPQKASTRFLMLVNNSKQLLHTGNLFKIRYFERMKLWVKKLILKGFPNSINGWDEILSATVGIGNFADRGIFYQVVGI